MCRCRVRSSPNGKKDCILLPSLKPEARRNTVFVFCIFFGFFFAVPATASEKCFPTPNVLKSDSVFFHRFVSAAEKERSG